MDWSNGPSLTQNYSALVSSIVARDNDCAVMFDGTGSNLPDGTFRFTASNSLFTVWSSSGAEWVVPTLKYAINVSSSERLQNKLRDVYADNSNGNPNVSDTAVFIHALASSEWSGIGPSGASTVWTALDGIPSDVDWIEVAVDGWLTHSSTVQADLALHARSAVGAQATGIDNRIYYIIDRNAGGGANTRGHSNTSKIQVDARTFHANWIRTGPVDSVFMQMTLKGYGYNA